MDNPLLDAEPPPTHEPSGVSVRGVAIGAASIAVTIGVALLATGALDAWLGSRPSEAERASPPPGDFRPTTATANLAQQLDALRAREQRRLEEFAWVDRERKIARLPIERAMELAARRKFAPISQGEGPSSSDQSRPAPSSASQSPAPPGPAPE